MTFLFTHKHSSAVMTLSTSTDIEAEKEFDELVANPEQWRMEEYDNE